MKRRPSVSVPKGYAAAWAKLFARSPEELAEQAKASAAGRMVNADSQPRQALQPHDDRRDRGAMN